MRQFHRLQIEVRQELEDHVSASITCCFEFSLMTGLDVMGSNKFFRDSMHSPFAYASASHQRSSSSVPNVSTRTTFLPGPSANSFFPSTWINPFFAASLSMISSIFRTAVTIASYSSSVMFEISKASHFDRCYGHKPRILW